MVYVTCNLAGRSLSRPAVASWLSSRDAEIFLSHYAIGTLVIFTTSMPTMSFYGITSINGLTPCSGRQTEA